MLLHNELKIFWENVDKYIANNTINEEIDNLFPFVLFENDKIFIEYFDLIKLELQAIYNTNVEIDLTYPDICRAIVNNMKLIATEYKELNFDILLNIITTIFEVAINKALLKEADLHNGINNIIQSLKENK